MPRPLLIFALFLVLLCGGVGCVGTVEKGEMDDDCDSGSVAFDFGQIPSGSYAGSFTAVGSALSPGEPVPQAGAAVGGGRASYAAGDTVRTAAYAVVDNGDGTFDGWILLLATAGQPAQATYQVADSGPGARFAFVDDATAFAPPDTLSPDRVMTWLAALPSARTLVAATGSVSLSLVSTDSLAGTFAGTLVDQADDRFTVALTNGAFALSGATPAPVPATGSRSLALQAAPNPFNPRTTVAFSLPSDQPVRCEVVDVAGRRVAVLHDGSLAAGPHRLSWDGTNARGRRAPAGVYVIRVAGPTARASTRVTLLP